MVSVMSSKTELVSEESPGDHYTTPYIIASVLTQLLHLNCLRPMHIQACTLVVFLRDIRLAAFLSDIRLAAFLREISDLRCF